MFTGAQVGFRTSKKGLCLDVRSEEVSESSIIDELSTHFLEVRRRDKGRLPWTSAKRQLCLVFFRNNII